MNQLDSDVRAEKKATRDFAGKALDFLIRLSETDPVVLASGQPGDLPNAIFGLYRFAFLVLQNERVSHGRPDEIDRLTESLRRRPDLLRPIIDSARDLLAAAADGGRFEWNLDPGSKLIFDGAKDAASNQRLVLSNAKEPPLGLEQAVAVRAMQYLGTEAGGTVRRCARSLSCRRIFLATRPKQLFCTRRCASAAAFERYKAGLGEEDYRASHRKTARASWRRLKQRRLGRKVTPRIKDPRKEKGA